MNRFFISGSRSESTNHLGPHSPSGGNPEQRPSLANLYSAEHWIQHKKFTTTKSLAY